VVPNVNDPQQLDKRTPIITDLWKVKRVEASPLVDSW
jgi:hypothetical protein